MIVWATALVRSPFITVRLPLQWNSCKSVTLCYWWKNKHRPIVLRILEGSRQTELHRTDALFVWIFVMFSIWWLLTWEALARLKLPTALRFCKGSLGLWWPRNRTAWLSGRMGEEGPGVGGGGLVCERPVGEEAADPWLTTKSHNSRFLFKQRMLSSKMPHYLGAQDFVPILRTAHHFLAWVLRIWHLY
jgi:hypothetical protein